MSMTASPLSETQTKCLLAVFTALVRHQMGPWENKTHCQQLVKVTVWSLGVGRPGECLFMCNYSDYSTDRGLRSKAAHVNAITHTPPFCVCQGRNQTCSRILIIFHLIIPCSNYSATTGLRYLNNTYCMKVNLTKPDINNLRVLHATPGLGMISEHGWACGSSVFWFLPPNYAGCCYLARVSTPLLITSVSDFVNHTVNYTSPSGIHKRTLATFSEQDFFHYRISLGEKWGIGLSPGTE